MSRRLSIAAALFAAAAALIPVTARAQSPEEGAERDGLSGQIQDSGVAVGSRTGWTPVGGLRVEQWLAPAGGGLLMNVRMALPEMVRGPFAIDTFRWERLDLYAPDSRDETGHIGTVYQVLGARYRHDTAGLGVFGGAHLMSWSGRARGFTPWVGFRLGRDGGVALHGEGRFLGLGLVGRATGGESTLANSDVAFRLTGPRRGRWQIEARWRARQADDRDQHQRDLSMAFGVRVDRGSDTQPRPVFVGVGLLHRAREPAGQDLEAAPMIETSAGSAPTRDVAVMLHLDVDLPLPRLSAL